MLPNLEIENRRGDFVNVVHDFAMTFFPELYNWYSEDLPGVIVHRVPTPGLPLDAALRRRFPNVRIRFEDSARCKSELMALTHRIVRDSPEWDSRGIHLIQIGPGIDGFVHVGLMETSESAMDEIRAFYGEAVVVSGGMQPGVSVPYRKQREIEAHPYYRGRR